MSKPTTKYEKACRKSAKELQAIRKSGGMTVRQFAVHLGVPLRTVENWVSGTCLASGSAWRILGANRPAYTRPKVIHNGSKVLKTSRSVRNKK